MKFRYKQPCRTCDKHYSNYRSYKKYLAQDFFNRCGYTDCSDFWFGGITTFHIDHFLPWSKHPELKNDYKNLVYCCSYVNILKSDEIGDYIDPCNEDYNKHFERDKMGAIIPITKKAKYMYKQMKMSLERYRLIWMLDKIEEKMTRLRLLLKTNKSPEKIDDYLKLSYIYEDYKKYLRAER